MITIAVWQLIIFVAAAIALGGFVAVWAFAKGKEATGQVTADPGAQALGQPKSPAKAVATAVARQEKVKNFLSKRIASRRNITVDDAAKCLDVSPRRVRRLLDDGVLVAIPTADGGRLVSAISVLDLITRREMVIAQQLRSADSRIGSALETARSIVAGDEKPGSKEEEVKEETVEEEKLVAEKLEAEKHKVEKLNSDAVAREKATKLTPGPRQLYWYYIKEHGEPLRTIREALDVLGIKYAYTGWTDIPASLRAKIQRERV